MDSLSVAADIEEAAAFVVAVAGAGAAVVLGLHHWEGVVGTDTAADVAQSVYGAIDSGPLLQLWQGQSFGQAEPGSDSFASSVVASVMLASH